MTSPLAIVAICVVAFFVLGGSVPMPRVSSSRVSGRENARGVHSSLVKLLDDWDLHGTHAVLIPSKPFGGLRTSASEQASYAGGGISNASTLDQTPHGRGAAIDVWPVEFSSYVNGSWEAVPQSVKDKFTAFGLFAEARGFTWGGRWRSSSMPNGDQPHVEIKNWRAMPFPPPSGGYVS